MDKYCKIKVLGEGSFGQAWLVNQRSTHESFVIKTISIPAMNERDKQAAINEVKILSTLRHKNIILYKDAFVHQKNLCLVMEYADDGDLSEKIKNQNGRLFLEMQIIDWFVQILIAVKYIHSLNILHRDLKSQNIFLTKTGFVKIGDFGVSKYLDNGLNQAKTTIGTPFYLSPEICQQKPYDHRSDMWSLGVLTYELATLKHPFVANDFSNLVVKIIKGKYPPISSCYGPLLQDLILVLLQVNPGDRPSASHLLKAPTLQTYVRSYLIRVKNGSAAPYNTHRKSEKGEALISTDERSRKGSLDSLDTSSSLSSANCSDVSEDNSHTLIQPPLENSDNTKQKLDPNQKPEMNGENVYTPIADESTNVEKTPDLNKKEARKNKSQTYTKLIPTEKHGKDRRMSSDSSKSKDITKTDEKQANTKTQRRTSLGTFRKIMEKPKERFSRRSSTGGIPNKETSDKEQKLHENFKHEVIINDLSKPHAVQNPKNKQVVVDQSPSPKKGSNMMCKRPQRGTAVANENSKRSPPQKPKINFIERNKKLQAATKHSPVRSKPAKPFHIQPKEQQQHPNAPSSKKCLYEERAFSTVNGSAKDKHAIKLTGTYTKLPTGETKTTFTEKKRTPNVTEATDKKHTVENYALKERSATFDNKKSFLKKFSTSIFQSSKRNQVNVQKCPSAEEIEELKDTFPIVERSASDLTKPNITTRKVRHQSTAFPEGFQVNNKVKKKILGRLRASSHACDEFGPPRIEEVVEKQQQNTQKVKEQLRKEMSREHSKTYTVLTPGNVLKNNLENQLGQGKLKEAMEALKSLKLSKNDALKLREAWNLVKKENEVNLLLSLIELKFCEAEIVEN